MDRPRASNRVNLTMAFELRQVCQKIREEEDVRVVVITGRGRVFSSGREPLPRRWGRSVDGRLEQLQHRRVSSALAQVELPTIAAINGDAIDQGLEMALACDLRVAARGAKLGFTDLARGVVPWDGGTQRLPRLIGRTRALEMLLTSRVLDAEEAHRWGLINVVVEPGELAAVAEKLALEIASRAPIALRYSKEAVLKGMDMPLDQGMRLEADLSIILQSSVDRAEGIRSFLEKREPNFQGE